MKKFTTLYNRANLPLQEKRRLPRRPSQGWNFSQRRRVVISALVLSMLLVPLVFTGCGKKTLYNMPAVEERGYYETAWIDPAVVLEDEWYTLLRSDRVDSFYVEIKPGEYKQLAPSVEFKISQFECLTTVHLMNGHGHIVKPLLVKNLRYGHYKFTFNIGRLKKEEMPVGDYFLKAEYCGFTVITDLGRL